MKVVVVGLGSMGKRRIRLLKQLYKDIKIVGIDLSKKRQEEARSLYQIETSDSLERACSNEVFDAAFVCTAPISHAKIIDECLTYYLHVFTEINIIADAYDELIKKAEDNKCILFLSSTMLYRKELEYIDCQVKEQKQGVSYNYHVGQYLPDWHPWESYKDFFVSCKRTNGCRELFAIELPWLVKTFGKIQSMHVEKSKVSNLDINYCDSYMVCLVHKTGHRGVLMLDVVSRKAVRRMEIVGESLYLVWEGTPDSLMHYDFDKKEEVMVKTYNEIDKSKNYSANIIENAYADEIIHFVKVISQEKGLIYSFKEDQEILGIIDEIEK